MSCDGQCSARQIQRKNYSLGTSNKKSWINHTLQGTYCKISHQTWNSKNHRLKSAKQESDMLVPWSVNPPKKPTYKMVVP